MDTNDCFDPIPLRGLMDQVFLHVIHLSGLSQQTHQAVKIVIAVKLDFDSAPFSLPFDEHFGTQHPGKIFRYTFKINIFRCL